MNDYTEILKICLTALVVVFTMAVYGNPVPPEQPKPADNEESGLPEVIGLPDEHPGGYELLLA